MWVKLRPFNIVWDARAKVGENLDMNDYAQYKEHNLTHLPVNVSAPDWPRAVCANSSGELTIGGAKAKPSIASHVSLIWDASIKEAVYLDMRSNMIVTRPPVIAPQDHATATEPVSYTHLTLPTKRIV